MNFTVIALTIHQCQTCVQADETILLVVMHVRQNGSTKSIPYSEATFKTVSEKTYQHRSMALSMPRTSTAIFNSRRASWKCGDSKEQSIGKSKFLLSRRNIILPGHSSISKGEIIRGLHLLSYHILAHLTSFLR